MPFVCASATSIRMSASGWPRPADAANRGASPSGSPEFIGQDEELLGRLYDHQFAFGRVPRVVERLLIKV